MDRIEIHELAARYGFAIDDRDWPGLGMIFTQDVIFHVIGSEPSVGIDALRSNMAQSRHPIAHHVTNVCAEADGDGAVMRSKVVGTLPGARAASADYRDRLRRTPDGWRICERVVTLRGTLPDTLAPPRKE
jgi:ketosteroid isomerase-like protein